MIFKIHTSLQGGQGPSTQISSLRSREPTDGFIVYASCRQPRSTHHPCIPHTIHPALALSYRIPMPKGDSEFTHKTSLEPPAYSARKRTNIKPPPVPKGGQKKRRSDTVPNSPSAREYPVTPKHEPTASIASSHMTTSQTGSLAPR